MHKSSSMAVGVAALSAGMWLVAVACDGDAAQEGEGEASGEGEGDGEGEGEGEPSIEVRFERDGVPLEGFELELGTHDAADGPLDVQLAVRNLGPAPFTILSDPPFLLAGTHAVEFSIEEQPQSSVVESQQAAPFVLRYAPTTVGDHHAKVVFAWGVTQEQRVLLDVGATATGDLDVAGVTAAIYDASFDQLPDFSTLTPTETLVTETFDISAREPDPLVDTRDNFAFLFEGEIEISTEGTYTFLTTSDDGSRLFIDGALIVDNDLLHGPTTKDGTVNLLPGRHAIRVQFFEKAGGASLVVQWNGPGIGTQEIPASVLFH